MTFQTSEKNFKRKQNNASSQDKYLDSARVGYHINGIGGGMGQASIISAAGMGTFTGMNSVSNNANNQLIANQNMLQMLNGGTGIGMGGSSGGGGGFLPDIHANLN